MNKRISVVFERGGAVHKVRGIPIDQTIASAEVDPIVCGPGILLRDANYDGLWIDRFFVAQSRLICSYPEK